MGTTSVLLALEPSLPKFYDLTVHFLFGFFSACSVAEFNPGG